MYAIAKELVKSTEIKQFFINNERILDIILEIIIKVKS